MTATIYHTNASRSMYSARLSNGSFTVFELVDPIELQRNTTVSGDFELCGEHEISLDDNRLHVHIDNCGLSEVMAFHKTFLIV